MTFQRILSVFIDHKIPFGADDSVESSTYEILQILRADLVALESRNLNELTTEFIN